MTSVQNPAAKENDYILELKDLKKYFRIKSKKTFGEHPILKAVDGVSFRIKRGEIFGLVGESGCGKTTLGRTAVRLYDPTGGQIIFNGQDITNLSHKELIPLKQKMQIIFQDPYASLNPRLTVGDIIAEPMVIHKMFTPAERTERVQELLRVVGLKPDHIRRYPHEFSGGQRQRVGIARALAMGPEFIMCDEPISALDVSIQAQIINMLEELQQKRNLSYLFVAHDLSMVRHICHRIGVMYLGNLVECGSCRDVYKEPKHPYTQALLSAVPIPDPDRAAAKERIILEGEIPSPVNPPAGCPFSTRCPHATDRCKEEKPVLRDVDGTMVACHLYD